MKKNLFSLMSLFIASVLLFSCTDLSDVNDRLDKHEERLKALEEMTSKVNSTLANLQKLVDAQNQKITITSFKMLEDGSGYKLLMSDGSEIILHNGKDGTTPAIGVTTREGIVYWTINNELIRDANGNPIPAEGKDGAPGIAPKLRVNVNGQWEVSKDGGKTWQLVTDTEGNPVTAIGKDGDANLSITDNGDGTIKIIYNGQTFIIPINSNNEDPEPTPGPSDRPKLPIEYFAKFAINNDGNGFVNNHDIHNTSIGYYNWYILNGKQHEVYNTEGTNLLENSAFDGWHLPDKSEWLGIVPNIYDLGFGYTLEMKNVSEDITINGISENYLSSYISRGGKAFGVRFYWKDITKPTDMKCAYKYEYIEDETLGDYLQITVRYLGDNNEDPTVEIQEVVKSEWWETNNSHDIKVVFPAYGRHLSSGSDGIGNSERPARFGLGGYYWAASEYIDGYETGNSSQALDMMFTKSSGPSIYDWNKKSQAFPVILVKDAE